MSAAPSTPAAPQAPAAAPTDEPVYAPHTTNDQAVIAGAQTLASLARAEMNKRPSLSFLTSLVMEMPVVAVVTPECRTAATDGTTIFVNAYWFAALDTPMQCFTLVHEALHGTLRHKSRKGTRDPETFNIATDAKINGMIEELFQEKRGYPEYKRMTSLVHADQLWLKKDAQGNLNGERWISKEDEALLKAAPEEQTYEALYAIKTKLNPQAPKPSACLLYTSDAADDM
jgi:hypothetical protein